MRIRDNERKQQETSDVAFQPGQHETIQSSVSWTRTETGSAEIHQTVSVIITSALSCAASRRGLVVLVTLFAHTALLLRNTLHKYLGQHFITKGISITTICHLLDGAGFLSGKKLEGCVSTNASSQRDDIIVALWR